MSEPLDAAVLRPCLHGCCALCCMPAPRQAPAALSVVCLRCPAIFYDYRHKQLAIAHPPLSVICLCCHGTCRETRQWMLGTSDERMPDFLGGRSAVVWAREYSTEDAHKCDCNALRTALSMIPGAKRMVGGACSMYTSLHRRGTVSTTCMSWKQGMCEALAVCHPPAKSGSASAGCGAHNTRSGHKQCLPGAGVSH